LVSCIKENLATLLSTPSRGAKKFSQTFVAKVGPKVIFYSEKTHLFKKSIQTPFSRAQHQGCQMVCFQTKNPKLGKFWRAF
jgi:hypothetical protein